MGLQPSPSQACETKEGLAGPGASASPREDPHTHCSGLEGTLWRLWVSGVKSCGSSGEEEPRDASPWDHEVCTLPSFPPGLLPGLGEGKHVVSDPQGHPWAGPHHPGPHFCQWACCLVGFGVCLTNSSITSTGEFQGSFQPRVHKWRGWVSLPGVGTWSVGTARVAAERWIVAPALLLCVRPQEPKSLGNHCLHMGPGQATDRLQGGCASQALPSLGPQ